MGKKTKHLEIVSHVLFCSIRTIICDTIWARSLLQQALDSVVDGAVHAQQHEGGGPGREALQQQRGPDVARERRRVALPSPHAYLPCELALCARLHTVHYKIVYDTTRSREKC